MRSISKLRQPPFLQVSLVVLVLVLTCSQPGKTGSPEPSQESVEEEIGTAVSLSLSDSKILPFYTGCGGVTPLGSANPAYEQQVVELVNTERANQGLPPYKRSPLLDNSARYHAIDMLQDNYFDHDTKDRNGGDLVTVCYWFNRIFSFYPPPAPLGENIAYGYTSPASVMNAWLNSGSHRDIILDKGFWEIGVGYYTDASTKTYWVQDFGWREGVYPLIINRDFASTTSRQVSIHIYGSFSQMRLKNDNDPIGAWQPFQNDFNWTMNCGVGKHSVTAELKTDPGGTVFTTSDEIDLTVSGCPYLGGLPAMVSFIYSQQEDVIFPDSFSLTPVNTVTFEAINWSLAKSGSGFDVSPLQGNTPSSFLITPSGYKNLPVGINSGSVTVTATAPVTTEGTPKTVLVRIVVVEGPLSKLYSPAIFR